MKPEERRERSADVDQGAYSTWPRTFAGGLDVIEEIEDGLLPELRLVGGGVVRGAADGGEARVREQGGVADRAGVEEVPFAA